MKRFFALAAAMVLALSVSMTAFAAPSPNATVATETAGVTVAPAASEAPTIANVQVLVESAGIDADDAVILATVEIAGELPADGTVVLTYPGMTSSTKIVVLHLVNGTWVKESATAQDGKIVISGLTSLSPFVIIAEADTNNGGSGSHSSSSSSSSSSTTSPQTADNGVLGAEVVAVLAIAGLAIISRRKVNA